MGEAKSRRRSARKQLTPYLFILPTVVALILLSMYPFISGIWYAFTDIEIVGGPANFVGVGNFERILKGEAGSARFFKQAFWQGIIWTVGVVGGQLILGYITALLLNERVPGRGIFRTLILLPWVIPSVVMALTWQWMYDPFFGLINFYLKALGFIDKPQAWVGQPQSSIWPVIVVAIWRGLPFMALMLLSGLQSIPEELWNSFDLQRIMSPVGSLGYNMMTVPVLAWFESFNWHHLGRGAAISVVSLVFMFALMVLNVRRQMRAVE
jgi:multiple sugar transport system permease protein